MRVLDEWPRHRGMGTATSPSTRQQARRTSRHQGSPKSAGYRPPYLLRSSTGPASTLAATLAAVGGTVISPAPSPVRWPAFRCPRRKLPVAVMEAESLVVARSASITSSWATGLRVLRLTLMPPTLRAQNPPAFPPLPARFLGAAVVTPRLRTLARCAGASATPSTMCSCMGRAVGLWPQQLDANGQLPRDRMPRNVNPRPIVNRVEQRVSKSKRLDRRRWR